MRTWVLDHTRLALALGAAMAVIGVLCLPWPRIYVERDPLLSGEC